MPKLDANVSVWQWVSGVLATSMMTGMAAWFTFGGGVNRNEAIDLIQSHSPYVEDRNFIRQKLSDISDDINDVKRDVRDMNNRRLKK